MVTMLKIVISNGINKVNRMNLNNYESQIKELLLARRDPYYSDLFDKILSGESASDKFLIKMEITRLSKPCQRIIDLRDKSLLECTPFTYKDTLHYLNLHAKEDFEKSIEIYTEYTIGVFEYVNKQHLKRKKQLQNDKSKQILATAINHQCQLISLSETNKRAAPRMFFVSDIELEFEDGAKTEAQTTNISISGLRVKLKDPIKLNGKQIIKISFTSLKREYVSIKALVSATYQLVGQNTLEDVQYLYLTYASDDQALVNFIQHFIRTNQYKYKIDVSYYYQLAKNKLLTHYYLTNSNKLVIALNCESSTPFLFSIENKQNKKLIEYWQSNNENNLYSLFNESRASALLNSEQDNIQTTLYSFTYQNNGIRYYLSATEEELVANNMKGLFIHYGCRKESWRVYNLTAIKYKHHYAESSTTRIKIQNKQLSNITHLVTLEDISQSPRFSENISGQDLNVLNRFVHHNHIQGRQNTLQLIPEERRLEPRYKYQSNIEVVLADKPYPAQIIDLSSSGLKIKLQSPIDLKIGERLVINLTDLQKVSQKFTLSDMKYMLINQSAGNILHLQVADPKTHQLAKTFFALLIRHNPNHFEVLLPQNSQANLINDLRQIQGSGHVSCALFVKKEKHLFNIKYAALDRSDNPLKSLFSILSNNKNEINTTPIINNKLYRRLISTPLNTNKLNEEGTIIESVIYVVATAQRADKWHIKSYLDEDFSSLKERDDFIEYSKERSQFYVLHYRLTNLNRPDFSIIQQEMDAISRFALHLTKKLQDDLLTMCGLIEITDCTKAFKQLSQE